MRIVNDIVVHETDTPTGRSVTVQDVDSWHRERGWNRDPAAMKVFNPSLTSIGYHFLINVDGSVHTGRDISEVGAHCPPNGHSIGIALAGKGKYFPAQWAALGDLVQSLEGRFPGVKVSGHREWESARIQGKTCPDFDVQAWVAGGMIPPADHMAGV